jgi:amidohydrolase
LQTLSLDALVEGIKDDLVAWRRRFHRDPELSFHEEETSRFVYETLDSFGNLELSRPTKTSVVARLVGGSPGYTIALRADMDALPIQEENDFEFASTNPGVMHACGHDGHTAMLLGAAKLLSGMKDRIDGEVRFIFQHAEELLPGGARELVDAGVMDGVDNVVGIHLSSALPVGTIGVCYGASMAAPDSFDVKVTGRGGHAAKPHEAVDGIAIGAQVVTNLQHVVSRNTDPIDNVVLSITRFTGGTAYNVIPGTVEMAGTVRTLDPETRERMPELMERVIKGITEAHGAGYEFSYHRGYRPVINEEKTTRAIEETAREIFGDERVEVTSPIMGGEDFSAYQQKAPGVFFQVGARNEGEGITAPHHHPRFTIDEDALPVGVRMFLGATFRLLNGAA